MSSLKERIHQLEQDLKATPMRISVFRDLPFAILRYDPAEEWTLRSEQRLLATRLQAAGREVVSSSPRLRAAYAPRYCARELGAGASCGRARASSFLGHRPQLVERPTGALQTDADVNVDRGPARD